LKPEQAKRSCFSDEKAKKVVGMLLRWLGDIRDDEVRDFGDFFEWKFFWYCFFDNKFSK